MQKHLLLSIEFHSSESNRHITSTNIQYLKKSIYSILQMNTWNEATNGWVLLLKSSTDALEPVYQLKDEKCRTLLFFRQERKR
jgi:hypothetical protein